MFVMFCLETVYCLSSIFSVVQKRMIGHLIIQNKREIFCRFVTKKCVNSGQGGQAYYQLLFLISSFKPCIFEMPIL